MGYRRQQSIRLLKHSPWWVWGGYRTLIQDSTIHPKYLLHPHCENGDYVALNDFAWTYAMWFDSVLDRELRDGEGLTGENSLFPARKPDIDTFGVPRRTRKQRGWYHIHRSLCDLCSHDTTSSHEGTPLSSQAQQYSVASLLPSEIIHLIVSDLGDKTLNGGSSQGRTRPMRAAMVCKHWADVCLRGEWSERLHGLGRTTQLRSLVTAPGSYLKLSITDFEKLEFHLDETDVDDAAPWLHLVPDLHRLLPNHLQTEAVTLKGPLRHGIPTMRSIHVYLPRSMPPAFFQGIRLLTIEDVQFMRLCDLEHVLREMSGLMDFKGVRLIWESTKAWPRPRMRRRVGENPLVTSPNVHLEDCTSNLEAIRLVAAPHDAWVLLRAVLDAMVSNDPTVPVVATSKRKDRGRNDPPVQVLYKVTYHQFSVDQKLCVQLRVYQTWQADLDAPNAHQTHLLVWFNQSPKFVPYIGWQAFERAVEDYFQVQNVTFLRDGWQLFLHNRWEPLADEDQRFLLESLPMLAAAGKISFTRPIDEMVWEDVAVW